MTALPDFLESDDALAALIAGFEKGTWPIAQWTHAAHLALGASYILDGTNALDRLRGNIPNYNVSQGGANTEDAGYHETLTVFWHNLIRDFIRSLPEGLDRLTVVRAAVTEFAQKRDVFRYCYTFDVVKSREARAKWIPPDIRQEHQAEAGTALSPPRDNK